MHTDLFSPHIVPLLPFKAPITLPSRSTDTEYSISINTPDSNLTLDFKYLIYKRIWHIRIYNLNSNDLSISPCRCDSVHWSSTTPGLNPLIHGANCIAGKDSRVSPALCRPPLDRRPPSIYHERTIADPLPSICATKINLEPQPLVGLPWGHLYYNLLKIGPYVAGSLRLSWAPSQYKDRLIYVWRFPC